jgi:hypothetical protein
VFRDAKFAFKDEVYRERELNESELIQIKGSKKGFRA